jgi:hypothetical protein
MLRLTSWHKHTKYLSGHYFSCYSSALQRSIVVNVHPVMEREVSACWLIYLLSCCSECDDILLSNSVVSRAFHLLGQCKTDPDGDMNVSKITALVRMLGNLSVNREAAEMLLTESSVVSVLRMLLMSPYMHIQRETLWLVGNLLNHTSIEIQLLAKNSNWVESLEPLLSDAMCNIL